MKTDDLKKEVGKRIKSLRKKAKETQAELAKAIHVSQDNISKIEQGNVCLTLENQINIANHYHVSHDYICTGVSNDNLLETLIDYMNLKFKNCSDGEESFQYPILEINEIFFNYLLQSARAQYQKNIPKHIKELWLEDETKKFFTNIEKNGSSNHVNFVPVIERLIYPDDKKNEWKQSDLLRTIDKQIDTLGEK